MTTSVGTSRKLIDIRRKQRSWFIRTTGSGARQNATRGENTKDEAIGGPVTSGSLSMLTQTRLLRCPWAITLKKENKIRIAAASASEGPGGSSKPLRGEMRAAKVCGRVAKSIPA